MIVDVDTRPVADRRPVHYKLGDVLAEANRPPGLTHTVGNWSLAQIFHHLSRSLRVRHGGVRRSLSLAGAVISRNPRRSFFHDR